MLKLLRRGFNIKEIAESKAGEKYQGYQTHLIKFEHESLSLGDDKFQVCLRNNHSGKKRLSLLLAMEVFICANECFFARNSSVDSSITHLGNTNEQLECALGQIDSEIDRTTQTIQHMQSSAIPTKGIETQVYREAFREFRGIEMTSRDAEYMVESRLPGQHAETLWNSYQTIQRIMIRGGYHYSDTNKGYKRKMIRPITGIDSRIKLNQKLFEYMRDQLVIPYELPEMTQPIVIN